MITCETCFTPNALDATHCILCATVLQIPEACPVCGGDCASANPPVVDCPMRPTAIEALKHHDFAAAILTNTEARLNAEIESHLRQPSLFTEPSATNTYPPAGVVHIETIDSDVTKQQTVRDIAIGSAAIIAEKICDSASCDAVRAATDIQGATPLEWDDVTDWIDGSVVPHYIGWYDVQMRSRFNDDHAAEGITRFWFAGRDWFTGPRAAELEAPCVPRGNVFHWRGRAKP